MLAIRPSTRSPGGASWDNWPPAAALGCDAGGLVGGLGAMVRPAAAEHLAKNQKRILCFYMAGGLSQLESWDPKPKTDTGGPFRAIPTSVPGMHISELLPNVAKQMHHLMIVRGVNTKEDDHGKGGYMMTTGRRQTPAADYPTLGAVTAKALASQSIIAIPGHIRITPGGGGGRSDDAAYLGPRYASIVLGNGNPPANSARDGSLVAHGRRAAQSAAPPGGRAIPCRAAARR